MTKKQIVIQMHLPLLEPSFTTEELQELSVELDEIERHERNMFKLFQAARRRSNALQYGERVQRETSALPESSS